MTWIDLAIVIIPVAFVIGAAFYAHRYARSVVDFLAAGRVAGRYVISVGDLTAGLSVITLVAGCEQSYQTGYGVVFWSSIVAPVGIIMALTGYCTYRWRETRCLSKGQFIELRYGSRSFRIVTAFISTVSEAVTNAIGPAIAANFFIYYLGLPHRIMICGISLPCYVIIVALCLTLALLIIWPAGRISLLVTDCVQGLLSYPIFVIICGFILLKFSWNADISPVLWDRTPGQSFIDPYDVEQLRDFNLFALVVTLMSTVLNRASWIGNDTSNSGRTPHEQKMAGVLGSWRNGFACMMITLIAIVVIVFMNSGNFASATRFGVSSNEIRRTLSVRVLQEVVPDEALRAKAAAAVTALPNVPHVIGKDKPFSQQCNPDAPYFSAVQKTLGDSPEGRTQFQQYRTMFQQMMMPAVMSRLFPAGLFGLFCVLMIMLLVSTDDARIFNAAGCLVQDVILPFLKKGALSPQGHLLLLRLVSLGVTAFFFIVAVFFRQMDYINMFVTIMGALWLGGAGSIMIGGLYTRFGNLTGAWCAIIFGSGTSLLGLIFQRNWAMTIYPALEQWHWVVPIDSFLRAVSLPFDPWIQWHMNPVKFPINSYEIFFLSMILSIGSYVIGSLLTCRPYDLDRLLHRGKYADAESGTGTAAVKHWRSPSELLRAFLGITPEYTRGDRIIAWSVFVYSFLYSFCLCFAAVVVWNIFWRWPKPWWNMYFLIVTLIVPGIVGIVSTVWFSIVITP